MDISFYVLLAIACMVLLLAMWFCAASNTTKWGPDLTLELPPHVLHEALFGPTKVKIKEIFVRRDPIPSAPTELPYAPLLTNEQPIAMSKPPPMKTFNPSVTLNMDTAVRVLPPRYEPLHQVKPVYYKFTTEDQA